MPTRWLGLNKEDTIGGKDRRSRRKEDPRTPESKPSGRAMSGALASFYPFLTILTLLAVCRIRFTRTIPPKFPDLFLPIGIYHMTVVSHHLIDRLLRSHFLLEPGTRESNPRSANLPEANDNPTLQSCVDIAVSRSWWRT